MSNTTFIIGLVALLIGLYVVNKKSKKEESLDRDPEKDSERRFRDHTFQTHIPHPPVTKKSSNTVNKTPIAVDPYNQEPLRPDAVFVDIPMGDGILTVKTNPENVNKIRKYGLPNKSNSFQRGRQYQMTYTSKGSSQPIYDYNSGIDWLGVYILNELLNNDSNYDMNYEVEQNMNQTEFGGGQFGGAGANGTWDNNNTNINEQIPSDNGFVTEPDNYQSEDTTYQNNSNEDYNTFS